MFQTIALFKLADGHADDATREKAASALRAALGRGGYDAKVGLPADPAALKSWDLSLTVTLRTREQSIAFRAPAFFAAHAGLPAEAAGVVKSWTFDVG